MDNERHEEKARQVNNHRTKRQPSANIRRKDAIMSGKNIRELPKPQATEPFDKGDQNATIWISANDVLVRIMCAFAVGVMFGGILASYILGHR
jgi:hypothetical protein